MNIENALDKAKKLAEQKVERWVNENATPEKMERAVRVYLDNQQREIIAQLLGFSLSWGKLEVDNCNGRAGESAVGDWFRRRAGETVNKWLDEQAGKLPTLTKDATASLRKDYLNVFIETLAERLAEKAREDASKKFCEMTGATPEGGVA